MEETTTTKTTTLMEVGAGLAVEGATATLEQINGIRTYRSGEEYLIAMREDLAEWLARLYNSPPAPNVGGGGDAAAVTQFFNIDYDNFFDQLENGVVLCKVIINHFEQ